MLKNPRIPAAKLNHFHGIAHFGKRSLGSRCSAPIFLNANKKILSVDKLGKSGSKTSIEDLAILGGIPAFREKLHVGKPNIGDRSRLLARIDDMLDRRWLSNNGPYVQEFEQKVAVLLGVKNCVATCNATVALELTTRALGFTGEVIIPSFTFVSTAHALQWQEITPVFCDVDPQTHTIDPYALERMITPRTTGIIGVHLWGRPCNIDLLEKIAERRKLKLIFDASHAFGVSYRQRMIGNFGVAEIFSFHATKFLNSFEGGAVVTNDAELAAKIRLMKNFGFEGYDRVNYIGTNGKMSEVSAAMGLTGLESMADFITVNRENYHTYQQELSGVPGVQLVTYNEREQNNFQYIVVELDEHTTQVTRDQMLAILHAENILARRYFYPGCHRMEPYKSYFPHSGLLLPETEKLAGRVISLPTGNAVRVKDVRVICNIIRVVVEQGHGLRTKLQEMGI